MSRFNDMGARLKAAADGTNPADEPIAAEDEKEPEMTDTTPVEQTEAYAAGVKAANDRMNAVFASEHYVGREALAHKLLGKDMGAEDIVDVLADAPKAETPAADLGASQEAADEAARAEMRAEMEKQKNSDASDADPGNEAAKANNHGWADIHAEIQASRGA